MLRALVAGTAVLAAAALSACSGADEPAERAKSFGDPPVELVPEGAELTGVSFTSRAGEQVARAEDLRFEDKAPFLPLIAYRQFCDGVVLDEFGLAEPPLRVTARTPDRTVGLAFGNTNFTGAGTYATRQDSGCVYLVTTSSVHLMAQLAGQEAASLFVPPPKPEVNEDPGAGETPKPVVHPWVEQAKRHATPEAGVAVADHQGE